MKKPSTIEKFILIILTTIGFFYHFFATMYGLVFADLGGYARQVWPGYAINSCLFLAYIFLVTTNKLSRLMAWSIFGLLIVLVVFITYLQQGVFGSS